MTSTNWRAGVPAWSCSPPVTSSIGVLEPGRLTRRNATSSSGSDEALHEAST